MQAGALLSKGISKRRSVHPVKKIGRYVCFIETEKDSYVKEIGCRMDGMIVKYIS